MNKDKIIKDLKERNDKLSNQYRLKDIRCWHLEYENKELKKIIKKINDFIDYNKNRFEVINGVGLERIILTKDLEKEWEKINGKKYL